jgi:hypothetical protein
LQQDCVHLRSLAGYFERGVASQILTV